MSHYFNTSIQFPGGMTSNHTSASRADGSWGQISPIPGGVPPLPPAPEPLLSRPGHHPDGRLSSHVYWSARSFSLGADCVLPFFHIRNLLLAVPPPPATHFGWNPDKLSCLTSRHPEGRGSVLTKCISPVLVRASHPCHPSLALQPLPQRGSQLPADPSVGIFTADMWFISSCKTCKENLFQSIHCL